MKLKRPIMYKITMVLQIGWILIIVADIIAMALYASPIFALELWGGECQETIGLGYRITVLYPMSSIDNPATSTTYINAYGLLFGQAVLTVMNIVQGIRYRKIKRRTTNLTQESTVKI